MYNGKEGCIWKVGGNTESQAVGRAWAERKKQRWTGPGLQGELSAWGTLEGGIFISYTVYTRIEFGKHAHSMLELSFGNKGK